MRVHFINRFYWPDEQATAQLLTDLAEGLAARGHTVSVVASAPPRRGALLRDRNGVRLRYVRATRRASRGIAGRVVDFLTFYAGALWTLLRATRGGDVVVALTDPPLVGVIASWIAGLRGARLVHWVQDIYPEIAVALTGQRWLQLTRPMRDAAWRQAEACVVLGPAMARVVTNRGTSRSKVRIVPNWAPARVEPASGAEVEAMRHEWGLEGKFVIAYSGNLGRVHDLAPILHIAAALQAEGDEGVCFVFIGNGAQRAELEAETRRLALSNVHFHPAQPRVRLGAVLAIADVHLVTLKPGCEDYVFPSKTYGAAQAGRPVIFVGPPDSDPAQTIVGHGFGFAFSRERIADAAAALRNLHRNPALRATLSENAVRFALHDAATAVAAWDALLTGRSGELAESADTK